MTPAAALAASQVEGLRRCLERAPAGTVPPDSIHVAVSGGADSATLLAALVALTPADWAAAGFAAVPRLAAVHCNHGLQEAAAALEAAAVAAAAHAGLACEVLQLDIPRIPGQSLEAIARLHRYAALARVVPAGGWLLTAHHADDQAETLLLQALRGAGLEGLAAMPWIAALGAGHHARPLLATPRAALAAAAMELGLRDGQHHVHDPMNTDPHLDRSWLRTRLWPTLLERWPSAATTLARSAGHLHDALEVVDAVVLRDLAPLEEPFDCPELPPLAGLAPRTLSGAGLLALPVPRRAQVVRLWLRRQGFRAPPAARLATLANQLPAARGDAAPCVRWGDAMVHGWRGRLYARRVSGPSLAERLREAAPPPPPWRQDAPRMAALEVPLVGTPDASGALDLGTAGRYRLVPAAADGLHLPAGHRFVVRGRMGGERLQVGSGATDAHREVRKLLQAAAIPPWLREEVPFLWVVPAGAALPSAGDRLAAVGSRWVDAGLSVPPAEDSAGTACTGWRVVWDAPFG